MAGAIARALFSQESMYVIPAFGIAVAIKVFCNRLALFSVLAFPGVLLHEILHFIAGLVTNAQPVAISFVPERRGGRLVLGSVAFANLRWYNAAPAALAPIASAPMALLVAWALSQEGFEMSFATPLWWMLLASFFLGSIPSSTDWRLALRSWPCAVLLAAFCLVWVRFS